METKEEANKDGQNGQEQLFWVNWQLQEQLQEIQSGLTQFCAAMAMVMMN